MHRLRDRQSHREKRSIKVYFFASPNTHETIIWSSNELRGFNFNLEGIKVRPSMKIPFDEPCLVSCLGHTFTLW